MIETIGKRLERMRKEHGYIRQSDLGEIIHASKTSISSWETDKNLPPTDIVVELAKLYNVSIDYLLCVSDYRRPENADIGSETGLSEKSIEVLRRFQTEDESIFKDNLKGLNYILESLFESYNGVPSETPRKNTDMPGSRFSHFEYRRSDEDVAKIHSFVESHNVDLEEWETYTGYKHDNYVRESNISLQTTLKLQFSIDYEESYDLFNSIEQNPVSINVVPTTETILSCIYKYTHIREYLMNLFYLTELDYEYGFDYEIDLWYAKNLYNLQDILLKNREEITQSEVDEYMESRLLKAIKSEEEWD